MEKRGAAFDSMKIFAALHDDIAEGFVWLFQPGLPARSVVRITNTINRKRIYCEALQIDSNFLRRYELSRTSKISDVNTSIVMSAWYRDKLGGLKTLEEYPLEVVESKGWLSGLSKLRAQCTHPQLVVRMAIRIGLWSLFLGVLGLAGVM